MNRVIALIDGFNFYHPIDHYQKKKNICLKWLNYPSLLRYYLKQLPKPLQGELKEVYFFSALAHHRNEYSTGATDRHLTYINALKIAGVRVILSNFKRKQKKLWHSCPSAKPLFFGQSTVNCSISHISHEEKETDVRIACKLLELAVTDSFDTCLLLSADSDLIPALETLKRLSPSKQIILVTPPSKAKVDGLQSLCVRRISVGVNHLKNHQFPDIVNTSEGYALNNPWKIRENKEQS